MTSILFGVLFGGYVGPYLVCRTTLSLHDFLMLLSCVLECISRGILRLDWEIGSSTNQCYRWEFNLVS